MLVDTHALLWAIGAPERLSDAAREALSTTGHEVAIGTASLWEIAIKVSRGRLDLAADWQAAIERGRKHMGAPLADGRVGSLRARRSLALASSRPLRPHADRASPLREHDPDQQGLGIRRISGGSVVVARTRREGDGYEPLCLVQ